MNNAAGGIKRSKSFHSGESTCGHDHTYLVGEDAERSWSMSDESLSLAL